jgi:hypothetical protein
MSAKTFGRIFAVLVMGFIGGNQINVLLLRRFSSRQIFVAALLLQVATGLLFYAGSLTHILLLPSILALFFVSLSCVGLTFPNAAAIGLAPFSRHAGRASALLGFLQTAIGSLVSTLSEPSASAPSVRSSPPLRSLPSRFTLPAEPSSNPPWTSTPKEPSPSTSSQASAANFVCHYLELECHSNRTRAVFLPVHPFELLSGYFSVFCRARFEN